jgi:hypothetical protein
MAAFSVDLGYMFMANEQLHVTTDVSAKAAVIALSQGSSPQTAVTAAINCAASNTVCGSPLAIGSPNVTLGTVVHVANAAYYWTFVPGGTPPSAAQVTATVPVPLFFAPVLNTNTFSAARTSTAAFVRNKWCFVIDRSGSMCWDLSGVDDSYPPGTKSPPANQPPNPVGSRWAALEAAVQAFVSVASAAAVTNEAGLATFATTATADCPISANYAPIITALTNYGNNQMTGNTNLAAGLSTAINLFASSDDGTPWNKVIIVFSDGQWNTGSDPLGTNPNLILQATNAGITIHTVGLQLAQQDPTDPNFKNYQTTMHDLATRTGGMVLTANDASSLITVFRRLAETIPVILTQ